MKTGNDRPDNTRCILHVDMDAFFAAVEQHDRPELRGRPVIVGAAPDKRGVVSAASYEAREFGIHSAMPSREAYTRCPDAVFVRVNVKRYRQVSEHIFSIFEQFTPFIEPLSIDEAFLDVSGSKRLLGEGHKIARSIKERIKDQTGLTASVGVASNKFLAKIASDLEKPDGLVVVPWRQEEIEGFLAPLPVDRIWGVGKVSRRNLESIGIRLIGDIQKIGTEQLAQIMGLNRALHIKKLARGIDEREIETSREEKSISREHTFDEDCSDTREIEQVLITLVDDVGIQLRKAGKYASVAHLKLRWNNFRTITRQRPFERLTYDYQSLKELAFEIFRDQPIRKPVRLVGFGVTGLCNRSDSEAQLELFDTETDLERKRREKLSHIIDQIRNRFGQNSIYRMSSGNSGLP